MFVRATYRDDEEKSHLTNEYLFENSGSKEDLIETLCFYEERLKVNGIIGFCKSCGCPIYVEHKYIVFSISAISEIAMCASCTLKKLLNLNC